MQSKTQRVRYRSKKPMPPRDAVTEVSRVMKRSCGKTYREGVIGPVRVILPPDALEGRERLLSGCDLPLCMEPVSIIRVALPRDRPCR
jgi:hypothetical protein